MSTLITGPRFQALDVDGPVPGALISVYLAGGLTPVTTFNSPSMAMGTENPFPVECDGNGQAIIYADAVAHRIIVTTSAGVVISDDDNVLPPDALAGNLASIAGPGVGGGLVGFNPILSYALQTIGAALLTLPSLNCFAGVDPTYTTDCTAAVQAAITFSGVTVPAGSTYKLSAPIAVPSNRVIQGCGPTSLFKSPSGDISQFTLTGATGVVIRDIGVQAVAAGTTVVAGFLLTAGSNNNVIEGVTFTGLSYDGVLIKGNCSSNKVRRCTMTGWQSTTNALTQDSADVAILSVDGQAAPSDNIVESNTLLGGGNHGVLIQDPYTLTGVVPFGNKVIHNEIGAHTVYGVAVYMPATVVQFTAAQSGTVLTVSAVTGGTLAIGQDIATVAGAQMSRIVSLGTGTGGTGTYNMSLSQTVTGQTMTGSPQSNSNNIVFDNDIHDIQGSWAGNRASGMGTYVVGGGACGTEVAFNRYVNCCVQTNLTSLVPGAITVNGIPFGALPVLVVENTVSGQTKYDGISTASAAGIGNVYVAGNQITMPASNTTGYGIDVRSSNVTVARNKINMLISAGSLASIFVYANGVNLTDVFVEDNECNGSSYNIQVTQTGSSTITGFSLQSNKGKGAVSGIVVDALLQDGSIAGNRMSCGSSPALSLTAVLKTRVTNNQFYSTGTNSVVLAGACTGSIFDKTNDFNALMNDTSTGFYKEILVAAIPSTGTWALPARAQNTVGTSATASAWRLTVAGSPGTWTSEGANP